MVLIADLRVPSAAWNPHSLSKPALRTLSAAFSRALGVKSFYREDR